MVWVFPTLFVLCRISPLSVSSWHSTLVLSLRTDNAACTSAPRPHLLWVDVSMRATSQLVIAVHCDLCGGFFPVMLSSEIPELPTDPASDRVCYYVETSPPSWLPPQDGSPFVFILFYLFIYFLLYDIVLVLPYINMHPEPPSYLPPHTNPLGHPSAPAPSFLYPASNLDWWFISYMILYMF